MARASFQARLIPARGPEEYPEPDISRLDDCIKDAQTAILEGDAGPEDPTNYADLMNRLESARTKTPPLYIKTVYKPFCDILRDIGEAGFNEVLASDPNRVGVVGLMMDIAHSILQNAEGYQSKSTDAFQEVISDLYDGFLSAEDRQFVKPPDYSVFAPLVKWGNPESGPYTWPINATSVFKLETAVVSLPPTHARMGLLAWSALGHETAGHDILHADEGLHLELARHVRTALRDEGLSDYVASYWADRIDETASDVLGILNMGPAAGIGLIGFFRGFSSPGEEAKLRSFAFKNDVHPADVMRGYLAASTIGLLEFDGAGKWADVISRETDKDMSEEGVPVVYAHRGEYHIDKLISVEEVRKSAGVVARTLVQQKVQCLEDHALGEIQNWRNHDERIISDLREAVSGRAKLPERYADDGIYAAHVVSAAVTSALAGDAGIPDIFGEMVTALKAMHDVNPSWGPLYVVHPSTIVRHRIGYTPTAVFAQKKGAPA